MRYLIILATVVLHTQFCSAAQPFTGIKAGLSKAEIQHRLGSPDNVRRSGRVEQWQYTTFDPESKRQQIKTLYIINGRLDYIHTSNMVNVSILSSDQFNQSYRKKKQQVTERKAEP